MFTNIKVALMDDAELASGDISVFGIELNLFVPSYAETTSTASCTIRTDCTSGGGFVQCTSPKNDCQRFSGISVTCDGTTTYC